MDELTRERFWPGTHIFVPDGVDYIDKVERCRMPIGDDVCGMPRGNRVHEVWLVDEKQDEHRRRAGEVEAA